MPLVKALKSFKGRYGHIRAGTTFNCEPGYFSKLAAKGWVTLAKEGDTPEPAPAAPLEPGPDKNRKKPEAPHHAGKSAAATKRGGPKSVGGGAAKPAKATEPPAAVGAAITSRSLRRDLASTHWTPNDSDDGGTNAPPPDTKGPADE